MVNWQEFRGTPNEWDAQLARLHGNFYQSYGWAEVRRLMGWKPLRLVATAGDGVVAVASLLVKRKFGVAICWAPGGPAGAVDNLDARFKQAVKRHLGAVVSYCRISLLRAGVDSEKTMLAEQGWTSPTVLMSSGLTMVYSLAGDAEHRLESASKNWTRNLRRSNRYELKIEQWKDPDLEAISALYREMEEMKSLPVQHTADELSAMFKEFGHQIVMYRCMDAQNNLLAVRAAAILGDTAMDLLAVASTAARKVYASHATLWALLDHCSTLGLIHYDLSGVDPESNKGVYDFKHGTGAQLVECIGEREWASFPLLCSVVNRMAARKIHA